MRRIHVVLNPNSRKNRGRDRVARLREILGERGEVHVTSATEAIAPLLERILDDDLACLVSDGGDGALHWALNAALPIVARSKRALPIVLPTNGGTIDFVARKAGVHGRAETLIARLVRAMDRGALETVEVGSLELRGVHVGGTPFQRIGFALAAGGVGQRFFDKYYADREPGAGTIVKVVARTIASLARGGEYARDVFRPHRARVWIDGEEVATTTHGAIHAGAFDVNLGGVFRVFPLARELGALHFQAGAISPAQIVANVPQLVRGGAIRAPEMKDVRGREMVIEVIGDEPLRPVIDGEIYEGLRRLEVRRGPVVRIARI
ncbi:diacylglycerol/lipid kinase family protein [Sandaracinus amylolyticus]|uniref:DAG-kinase catalytic domain protein n=1 Tax=Sandaracinus amylolyticus TaxID=927083 RepID=A0A0F6SFB3_9BACT|nr:diacylglycerol kinase family protein [Sandaracinus amylolyticus]AKF06644.1 DAG-kinase catalytic domain protein [Sandaracinus amylolyticus]